MATPADNAPFDRHLVARRRERAIATTERAGFLLTHAVDDLVARLGAVQRAFPRAAILGDQGGRMLPALEADGAIARHGITHLIQTESTVTLAAAARGGAPRPPEKDPKHFVVVADEEILPFADASLDLLLSPLVLQAVNDLPGALIQVRRALRPDGLALITLLGGDTLTELRQAFLAAEVETIGGASPRVAPFADVRSLGQLLQRAGFALPVADRDVLTVRYDHALALLRDLRDLGWSNALKERSRRPLTRTTLERLVQVYARDHADADGRIRATFEIVTLTAWAPSPTQQQPLRPGSAQARLADALGTTERSAGDVTPVPRPASPAKRDD